MAAFCGKVAENISHPTLGCSGWVGSEHGAPADATRIYDQIDGLTEAIAEEFGSVFPYERTAADGWIDHETGEAVPADYAEFPVIDDEIGAIWFRINGPALEGIGLESHPWAIVSILSAPSCSSGTSYTPA